jgi:cytidylate kinase
LKPAADASRIDTSALDADEVFARAVAIVDPRLSSP